MVRAVRKPPPVPFSPGDAVLVAGDGWHHPDAGELLLSLQKALDLRVAHVVYDITPLRHPQWCHPPLTHAFTQWLASVFPASKLLLTISEHSRRDLLAHGRQYGTTVPPIEAIRLGDEPGADDAEEAPAGALGG